MGSKSTEISAHASRSIRTKVTIFAMIATLVPSVVLGLLYYSNNRDLLEDKISQGLHNTTDFVTRDTAQWISERRHDLGVYGSSPPLLENIGPASAGDTDARADIADFLASVLSRSPAFSELGIFANDGQPVVVTGANSWNLPGNWLTSTSLGELPLAQPDLSEDDARLSVLMGERMTDYDGLPAGFVVGRVQFEALDSMLSRITTENGDSAYVIDGLRRVIARDRAAMLKNNDIVGQSLIERMQMGQIINSWHQDGTEVVALLAALPGTEWSVIAERKTEIAYQDIRQLQGITLLILVSLLASMAGIAYLFADRLSAPLRRLTDGASRVAGGDLDVEIEVDGRDEIAYLTQVFNNMVKRLEASRSQVDQVNRKLREQNKSLQVLSNTDALTGLYNRQHLNDKLDRLIASSEKDEVPFAILMLDLDRFKELNDRYGHLAGDKALQQIAEHIGDTLRKSDYAARYGGEEFVVLLPKVDGPHAFELAERLRVAVASTPLHFDGHDLHVTTSIGVAAFPECGHDADTLTKRADEALYQAKDAGRNTTVMAGKPNLKVVEAEIG